MGKSSVTMSRALALAAAIAVLFIAASNVEAYPRTRTVKVRQEGACAFGKDVGSYTERGYKVGPRLRVSYAWPSMDVA